MKVTAQTYIISDHHFFHKNIVEYAQRPVDHMEILVAEHNAVVKKEDRVLFLGDLSFADKEKTGLMISRLNGTKYIILGNHDRHNDSWYQDIGFEVSESIFKVFVDGKDSYPIIFSHRPVPFLPESYYNIHGHIHRGVKTDFPLSPKYFNASCEVLNYKPILLEDIIKTFKERNYSGIS